LKAGTATKLVLNMLTTGAMVRLGKVFGNLMVDLRATNNKLRARTNRIVRQLTGLDQQAAAELLERCSGELKTALVTSLKRVEPDEARRRLTAAGGQVHGALEMDAFSDAKALQTAAGSRSHDEMVLGIDGGGTHTVALLARLTSDQTATTHLSALTPRQLLGRGEAGPSNPRSVGVERALQALDSAIGKAFESAELSRCPVRAAWFGLAGAGRPEDQEPIRRWAIQRNLAARVEVCADAPLLLAAGTPDGWGLAIVAGTGSMAFARSPDGRTSRAGGWGYLLGDEGSGYALGLAALQAVARMADGRGRETILSASLLDNLQLKRADELIAAIYRDAIGPPAIAALAPLVIEAADADDSVASGIVQHGANHLASAAAIAAGHLGLPRRCPLALAGGLLLASASYRDRVLKSLEVVQGILPEPITLVPEPAEGAVRLALSHAFEPT
jgi:N-acetylglucosamine kinase-like BadF-type ATPase